MDYIKKPVLVLLAGGVTYLTISSLKSWLFKQSSPVSSQVLFFPDKKQICPYFLKHSKCSNEECLYGHAETSIWNLIGTLDSASQCIDVCVFTITSHSLTEMLIKKHNEGIIVRVITDCEKMDLNCSRIEQMRASGIQVRHDKTSYFMHHKFAIIDRKMLINGSFNWTKQAITGNQENVIISRDIDLVNPYHKQFKKLWKMYNPTAAG